jgi:hypothetical protein
MYIQQFSKKADAKKSSKFSFLYIIMINMPPTKKDDIYIKSFYLSAKKNTTTIHTDMNTIAFKFSSICRCTN